MESSKPKCLTPLRLFASGRISTRTFCIVLFDLHRAIAVLQLGRVVALCAGVAVSVVLVDKSRSITSFQNGIACLFAVFLFVWAINFMFNPKVEPFVLHQVYRSRRMCLACGYSLLHVPIGVSTKCPECGTAQLS